MATQTIVILGGGISGLAAGWFAKQKYGPMAQIHILEKDSRLGGCIKTVFQDQFLFEQGPRSLRTQSLNGPTRLLIEQLNLVNDIILPDREAGHRYLYENHRLLELPSSLWKLPFSRLTRGWWGAIKKDILTKKREVSDESIESFFCRQIGKDWAERLVDPFISGIFAGDSSQLSIKSCFPDLCKTVEENGSLIKGLFKKKGAHKKIENSFKIESPFFTFRNGMGALIHALNERLLNEIHLNTEVIGLTRHQEKTVVHLASGQKIKADKVISALPSTSLARLFPQLADCLYKITYAAVMLVNLGYRKQVLKKKGFGYLIPSKEREPILGCVWDSTAFSQQNTSTKETRLTVMIGGARHPDVLTMPLEKGVEIAQAALKKHLQIDCIPDSIAVRAPWESIPQYHIGYEIIKNEIKNKLKKIDPNICLIGSAFNGVSVTDCILGAYQSLEDQDS